MTSMLPSISLLVPGMRPCEYWHDPTVAPEYIDLTPDRDIVEIKYSSSQCAGMQRVSIMLISCTCGGLRAIHTIGAYLQGPSWRVHSSNTIYILRNGLLSFSELDDCQTKRYSMRDIHDLLDSLSSMSKVRPDHLNVSLWIV